MVGGDRVGHHDLAAGHQPGLRTVQLKQDRRLGVKHLAELLHRRSISERGQFRLQLRVLGQRIDERPGQHGGGQRDRLGRPPLRIGMQRAQRRQIHLACLRQPARFLKALERRHQRFPGATIQHPGREAKMIEDDLHM
ncbi:hypothetical protein D9M73_137910 [compost metagenome]